MSFEHLHYDISSSAPGNEYVEKVYKIATGGLKELAITQKVLEIYEMRQRGEWEGPDSVYDAWLISNNSTRKWLPYKLFTKIYPDWEEQKNQITQDSDMENDSSTNGSASQQNLFISMSESDSENSDIAIARPKRKRKR